MKEIRIDSFTYFIPDDCRASKVDDWSFYRKNFINVMQREGVGVKCVDLIVYDTERNLWLVEVKDYRKNKREKEISLWEEISEKVLCTLAMLLPASLNAEGSEKEFARMVLQAKKLRVALHYELSSIPKRGFSKAKLFADLQNKLKKQIKSIDAHPKIIDIAHPNEKYGWRIQ